MKPRCRPITAAVRPVPRLIQTASKKSHVRIYQPSEKECNCKFANECFVDSVWLPFVLCSLSWWPVIKSQCAGTLSWSGAEYKRGWNSSRIRQGEQEEPHWQRWARWVFFFFLLVWLNQGQCWPSNLHVTLKVKVYGNDFFQVVNLLMFSNDYFSSPINSLWINSVNTLEPALMMRPVHLSLSSFAPRQLWKLWSFIHSFILRSSCTDL